MQSRLRILVIDDDPMFRSLVVSLLRKDYLVSVAADGESGFNKAREHRPDLAIIDHQMPGWNGVKTLQAFRNDRVLNTVKVMMLTSDASKETVLSAIQAGTNEYIIKTSFNKADFLAKVHKLLAPVLLQSATPTEAGTKTVSLTETPQSGEDTHHDLEIPLESSLHASTPVRETHHSAQASSSSGRTASSLSETSLPSHAAFSLDQDSDDRLNEILDEWED